MFTPAMLCILPKKDAYDSLSENDQFSISNIIYETVQEYVDKRVILYVISEDELAYDLLNRYNPISISTLNKLDTIFLSNYSDVDESYKKRAKNKYRTHLIAKSNNKNKAPIRDESESDEMFYSRKFKNVLNRIRSTSYYYMEEFSMVIYFDKKRQYVKPYTPIVGDGKVYIHVDLNSGIKERYYSGVLLSEEAFKTVMGGLLQWV